MSLGLLGIITEVTLECEPAFNLEEIFEKQSLDKCLANLEEISQSAEHVKLWLEVYSKSCDIYRFERTEKDVQMNPLIWRNLKVSPKILPRCVFTVSLYKDAPLGAIPLALFMATIPRSKHN